MYIYQITNKVNKKIYIGSTNNLEKRISQHITQLNHNAHCNKHLQAAWNKYGKENFNFEVLETVPFEMQFQKEQEYLNILCPFDNNGYNIKRKTYEGADSPHYIIKECKICGCSFETYNNIAKHCEECREAISKEYLMSKDSGYISNDEANRAFYQDCVIGCGYDSIDDFWECNGI